MRIEAISIEAFRGFQEKQRLVFPKADVLLLTGPNGYGKSSFFDAIEWGLTGKIYRFEDDPERKQYRFIGNHFAHPRQPSVTIELLDDLGREIRVHRTGKATLSSKTDCITSKLEVYIEGIPASEPEKQLHNLLINEDWRNHVDINKSLFLTHLLGQERMNVILRGMKENDRYDSVSVLFGTEQFIKYKSTFTELKKVLELRQKEVSMQKDVLIEKERIIISEGMRLKEEISSEDIFGNNTNLESMLHSYALEYGNKWDIAKEISYDDIFKELGKESEGIIKSRNTILQNEQQSLELANFSLASWKENKNKYNEVNEKKSNLELLFKVVQEQKRFLWLTDEFHTYKKASETLLSLGEKKKLVKKEIEENKLLLKQLEKATGSLDKVLKEAELNNDIYSKLTNSIEEDVKELPLDIKTSFLNALKGIEKAYLDYEEKLLLVHKNQDYLEQANKAVELLGLQEQQYRDLLDKVENFVQKRPNTTECPACGTQNINADYLLGYIETKRNEIHPDLARLDTQALKLQEELRDITTICKEFCGKLKDCILKAKNLISEHEKRILHLQERNEKLHEKYSIFQDEEDLINKSCTKFREEALKLDIDIHSNSLQSEIDTKLQGLVNKIEEDIKKYPDMNLLKIEDKILKYKDLLIKLDEIKTLFLRRMEQVGIQVEDNNIDDFEALLKSL